MHSYENEASSYERDLTAERDRLREVNAELVEIAQAFISFLEDKSESPRRRQACLQAARAAVAKATGD